jgi:hypothetical protein
MATGLESQTSTERADRQRQVVHPLHVLKDYIRTYVSAEGLATLALYLLLWFWLGLALDFGSFKVFGIDWVQELPWGLRATLLLLLSCGLATLIVTRLFLRLFRDFRDDALAMALERRFPAELGDRLITAVELSDPLVARRYGFSQAMIDRTAQDAAEQVRRLPVTDVLNWSRLRRAGIRIGVLSLGVFALVGLAYSVLAREGPSSFVGRFNNVAQIWFERNILLANTIWPRQVLLTLVDFPDNGDLRVGRNAPPPTLHVRALQWVVADPRATEGWRAMNWSDLTDALTGEPPPPSILPSAWRDRTLDQIEQELDKPQTQSGLSADAAGALRKYFAGLAERAASARMARRMRKLMVPGAVVVYYKGDTVRNEQTLKKLADNEYSGALSDLKESIRFTVAAQDYYTPYQRITLVPPPSLIELSRDEDRPAYLYHRQPADSSPQVLQGKKQRFRSLPMSLSGSASRLDVPTGTNVILRGQADKELQMPQGVRLLPHETNKAVGIEPHQLDAHSFEIRFDNVSTAFDFDIELTDTDRVSGRRHVIVKPMEDSPPDVDVMIEVIPKRSQGYMVTAAARIPFSGKARDDHGLDKLEYAYTVSAVESQARAAVAPAVSAMQLSPVCAAYVLVAPPYLSWLEAVLQNIADDSRRAPQLIPVAAFGRRLRENDPVPPTLADLDKSLGESPGTPLLRDHTFDPDEDSFDVEALHLRVTDDQQRETQPRYKLRLWVQATDNNVETGPGVSESKERFTFLVVPEDELLIEIGKTEENLRVKLDETVTKLKDSRSKLEQVALELPSLSANEFSPLARRIEEVQETLVKGWDVSREIFVDYRNILKELQVNRVNPKIVDRVEKNICEPLDGVINQEFVRADEAVREFYKTLEDKKASPPAAARSKEEMDKLIDRLMHILDSMADLTTINKLIEELKQIIQSEQQQAKRLREEKDRAAEDILNQALSPPQPKPEEKKRD